MADTGSFTNFTSPLNYEEMAEELRGKAPVKSVEDINHYLCMETDSGEFYLKYNGVRGEEFGYSFFADVGRVNDFGQYVYIPFHLLGYYPKYDCPAVATPFEDNVYLNGNFSVDDIATYYKDKGIYSVKEIDDTALTVMDRSSGYCFRIEVLSDCRLIITGSGEDTVASKLYRLTD